MLLPLFSPLLLHLLIDFYRGPYHAVTMSVFIVLYLMIAHEPPSSWLSYSFSLLTASSQLPAWFFVGDSKWLLYWINMLFSCITRKGAATGLIIFLTINYTVKTLSYYLLSPQSTAPDQFLAFVFSVFFWLFSYRTTSVTACLRTSWRPCSRLEQKLRAAGHSS